MMRRMDLFSLFSNGIARVQAVAGQPPCEILFQLLTFVQSHRHSHSQPPSPEHQSKFERPLEWNNELMMDEL
ncbi:hypothetical protein VIGAN_11097900 [Vigna angularis var. angularis]|uniref:Uncharacterized protein n=1 Tax=Vigna angularis var. angularis TaxID=157739 RepID=A0A0S3T908_PHAAN|nr:hypothetical protein VIGAN_11097900 [Vigna angularis var. angularis]